MYGKVDRVLIPKVRNLPFHIKETKVVLISAADYDKNHYDSVVLLREFNRTSGRTPYKHPYFKEWKKRGVLMLDYLERDEKEILWILSYLKTHVDHVIYFVATQNQDWNKIGNFIRLNAMAKHQYIFTSATFKKTNLFNKTNVIRRHHNLPAVDWNLYQ